MATPSLFSFRTSSIPFMPGMRMSETTQLERIDRRSARNASADS